MSIPSDQALWGVLCLSFFFLLRRSEIASSGKKFAWFALKAEDVAVLDINGLPANTAREASSVHIRLRGSKTNQRGTPTLRVLNRSGHNFLCPVFGALFLMQAHRGLPLDIPAAVFTNKFGRSECVSALSVTRSIRQAAAGLGYSLAEFSAHSLRAGGATHMYRAGEDALTIQFHGRLASDTFKQYTRLCKESVSALASNIVSGSKDMNRLQSELTESTSSNGGLNSLSRSS
ncbi:hypothetical protein PF005_g22569 [Phytophthora fragariae]|uniref:Tyr recombinase domain-containing protein n=1 Tax=Phytophthora fragariae TaxID=53985 RepID=A0A6A3WLV0_9STRA|nr:hypothetical protein PF005_g22569 [Phytophthora fragariae]